MHHAQDLILTVGSLVLMIALIPSILGEHKPALSTSASTGMVLVVFAGVYTSLRLWFAAIVTCLSGILWLVLAIQKFIQGNKKVK